MRGATSPGSNPPVRGRILAAAERLPQGDVRRLAGPPPIRYRLRVGDWRLIFRRDERAGWLILSVRHRRDAYR